MRIRASVIIGLALTITILSGCGSPAQRTTTGAQRTGTTLDVEKAGQGERTAVGDADGAIRGTFSEVDQDERRQRISERVVNERLFEAEEFEKPEARRPVLDALAVIDPVEVHDDDGTLTGYLTTHFVALEDYPEVRAQAERELVRLGVSS